MTQRVEYLKSHLSSMRKTDLEQIAIEREITIAGLSKPQVITAILQEQEIFNQTTDVPLEEDEGDTQVISTNIEIVDEQPHDDRPQEEPANNNLTPMSPEWTEHVLSHLHQDEYTDKYPSTDGLRRVFEKFVGEILERHIDPITTPLENQARATVLCRIRFLCHGEYGVGTKGVVKEVSDAADCFWGNTQKPFANHPVATAGTMAEGRCLRKIMNLRVQTMEEMQELDENAAQVAQDQIDSATPASDNHKNTISRLCNRLNIDVKKFLVSTADVNAESLDNLSLREAVELLRYLNSYNRGPDNGGKAIPTEILDGPPDPPPSDSPPDSGTMTKGG